MQEKDPYILAAMDGQELNAQDQTIIAPKPGIRDEPTAFFFVLFGLVFEALATSSADTSSSATTRQDTIVAALLALKNLVRPEYSGKAILEPTTFDEFITLCYRLSMTESAAVQIHLVEMLTILAISQQRGETCVFFPIFNDNACLWICAVMPYPWLRHRLTACAFVRNLRDISRPTPMAQLSVSTTLLNQGLRSQYLV